MKNAQINWIKVYLLSGFILICQTIFAQSSTFRYLDVNTLCKDKKVLLLKNQLPSGWQLRTNGSNFFIERINPVFLPQEALKSIETQTQPVDKVVNGRKMLLFKTKAYFLMTVEKRLPSDATKSNLKSIKSIYLTDYYTFFLWQKHGYTYSKHVLPANLYEEFRSIEKLLQETWML